MAKTCKQQLKSEMLLQTKTKVDIQHVVNVLMNTNNMVDYDEPLCWHSTKCSSLDGRADDTNEGDHFLED